MNRNSGNSLMLAALMLFGVGCGVALAVPPKGPGGGHPGGRAGGHVAPVQASSSPSSSSSSGGTRSSLPSLRGSGGSTRRSSGRSAGGIQAGGGSRRRKTRFAPRNSVQRSSSAPVTTEWSMGGSRSLFEGMSDLPEATAPSPQFNPLVGLAGKLEVLRSRAATAVETAGLSEEGLSGFQALFSELEDGGVDLELVEAFPEDRDDEAKALMKLYGRWYLGVEEVASDTVQAGNLEAYPLPDSELVLAYLKQAFERTDDPFVAASRVRLLGFLERTGFHEAVLGSSLLESFELVLGWLGELSADTLSEEDRFQVSPEIGRQGQAVLVTFLNVLEPRSGIPETLGVARASGKPDLGKPPAGLPPSLLRLVPRIEPEPAAVVAAPPSEIDAFDTMMDTPMDDGLPTEGGGMPWGSVLGALAALLAGVAFLRRGETEPGLVVPSPAPASPPLPAAREDTTQLSQAAIPVVPLPTKKEDATLVSQEPPTGRLSELPGWLRGMLETRLPLRYENVTMLASGGMGSVLRAWDTEKTRSVAIKVAPPHLASLPEYRIRFQREAQALARLDHPNIAGVYDVPECADDESPLIVMEFLDGSDLSDVLRSRGKVPLSQARSWVTQAGLALQYSHDEGLLHRDVKPGNLFLCNSGEVKLVDFGLVSIGDMTSVTVTGARMGSLPYMPPEQLRGERVDARADQYALAVTAYMLVGGAAPFSPEDPHRETVPDVCDLTPEAPERVGSALRRAMSPRADERFADVSAFVTAFCGESAGVTGVG